MKTKFNEERAKLVEMNKKDKLHYIWEYYKLHISVILITAIVAGGLINVWFINPPNQTYLHIAWQAHFVMPDTLISLEEHLGEIVQDHDSQDVLVHSYILDPGDPERFMAVQTMLFGSMTAGDLDLFILCRDGVQANTEGGILRPVYELVDTLAGIDMYVHNEIGNRIVSVTFTPDESQPPITESMAISLYGSPLLEAVGINSDGLYIGLVANSGRIYEASKALQMFLCNHFVTKATELLRFTHVS